MLTSVCSFLSSLFLFLCVWASEFVGSSWLVRALVVFFIGISCVVPGRTPFLCSSGSSLPPFPLLLHSRTPPSLPSPSLPPFSFPGEGVREVGRRGEGVREVGKRGEGVREERGGSEGGEGSREGGKRGEGVREVGRRGRCEWEGG